MRRTAGDGFKHKFLRERDTLKGGCQQSPKYSGVAQKVARRAHIPEVVGSIPAPASRQSDTYGRKEDIPTVQGKGHAAGGEDGGIHRRFLPNYDIQLLLRPGF